MGGAIGRNGKHLCIPFMRRVPSRNLSRVASMAGVQPTVDARPESGVVESPYAFFSYAHADIDSAILLVEELKLRGFSVFRDVERMREGRRLEHEMGEGIDEADLLMAYLTVASLASDPVVTKELKPALRKFDRYGRPVVFPVVVGLGANHEEVTAATWSRLQHDFTSTWSGGILGDAGDSLATGDAATLASKALKAVYPDGEGPNAGTWRLQVSTHGAANASDGLSVDGTSFLGGEQREIGHPASWQRVLRGLVDLERVLRGHGSRRDIEVTGAAHLTAAFATGFVFRRPTGWRLSVRADDGVCYPQTPGSSDGGLRIVGAPGTPDSRFITAEVNLLGREMDSLVEVALVSLDRPSLRLRVEHTADGYIPCGDLAAMASTTAAAIKGAVEERRAEQVHLFIAAPFAFGVFLGAALNATGAFIQLYEWADHHYHPSLELQGR